MGNDLTGDTRGEPYSIGWWLWMMDAAKDSMKLDFHRYDKLWGWIGKRIIARERRLIDRVDALRYSLDMLNASADLNPRFAPPPTDAQFLLNQVEAARLSSTGKGLPRAPRRKSQY